jgi:hypothetical protein
MAGTGSDFKLDSLRPRRVEGERLLLALAIAVLIHVLLWGGYELHRSMHWNPRLPWLKSKRPLVLQMPRYEQPLVLVIVQNPSTEAPQRNTPYFASHNSIAANQDADKITDQPKLDGKQTDVPATVDITHPQFSKSTTGENQRQQQDSSQALQNPKPESSAGDMTLGKPNPQDEQTRPRTLKEAYAQMANRLPSMSMREDGGVSRRARQASFDVKVTGFGDYDERFTETVSQNWWNLLDSKQFALDRTGKVVLLFRLNSDGTITQMRVAETTVGDLLAYVCEKSILEGVPYERWTEDMRLQLGDYIDVQFDFEY